MFQLLFFETKMCIINTKKRSKIINTSVRLQDSAKHLTWQAQRTTLHKTKTQNGIGKYAKCKKAAKAERKKRQNERDGRMQNLQKTQMEGAISMMNNWQAKSFLLWVIHNLRPGSS